MVYDCFIFFNELDLLEIRLNELYDVVDYFVLVEADRTFQNTPKPFIYELNKDRFAKFSSKIIHIKITDYPTFIPLINPFSPWKIEFFQRNAIVRGLKNCKPDDVILISDVDEIPNKQVLKNLIGNGVDRIYGLRMDLFLYFLDNKLLFDPGSNMTKEESQDGIWYCMAVLPYRKLTKKPNAIRRAIMRTRRKGEVYPIIPNAGWHFSYIGGVKKIIEKLEAFSHTEYNLAQYKDEAFISASIENGKDLFGRDMEFEIIAPEHPYPEYLKSGEAQIKFAEYFFRNRTK